MDPVSLLTDAVPSVTGLPVINVTIVADFLNKVLVAEPKFVQMFNTVRPYAKLLPAPFNLIADPTVQELVDSLPQLLPLLTELQQLLAAAADSK